MEDQSSTQTQPEGQGFRSDLDKNFQNSENSGLGQSPVLPQTTVAPVPPVPPKKCFAGSRFQITINNNPDYVFPQIRDYLEKFSAFQYIIACKEKAPTTGHEHMHIFVQYTRTVKLYVRFLKGAHCEKCFGSTPQNIDYIKKDGNIYYEKGEPKVPKHKIDEVWDQFIEDIHNDCIDKDSKMYARFRGYAEERLLELKEMKPYNGKLELKNYWIYGEAGCGKSSLVRQLFPANEIFNKPLNKWWDGYKGQRCVLLEDIDPDRAKILVHHIKIWADRFPFQSEVKCSTRAVCPDDYCLIITSNYSIAECFNERDADAVSRRFCEVAMPFDE